MKKALIIVIVIFIAVLLASKKSDLDVFEQINIPIVVDYSKSIEQIIKEGKYDEDSNISSYTFVKNGTIAKDSSVMKREAVFLNFNCSVQSEDVIAHMKLRGLRPGIAIELYSLGEQYPGLQREIDIIALGSSTADSSVPGLWEDVFGCRCTMLWRWSRTWSSDYWFLAFRE